MLKHFKLPNWLIKYTVTLVLIIIPLYPKFPFIKISGTFVSIRLEDFILLFAGLIVFINLVPWWKTAVKNNIYKSVVLYLVIGFVSLVSAYFVTRTIEIQIGLLHWIRRIEYFIPLFLGYYAIKSRKDSDYYFKLILVVIVLCFIYGFGQKYFEWPIIITQNEEYSKGVALRWLPGSHINSTFAGHYDLATFLVLVLPIITAAFFMIKGKMSKIIILFVGLSGLWLLVNTASRISLASFVVASGLTLIFIKKYKFIPLLFVLVLVFSGLSSNLRMRYLRIYDVIKKQTEMDNKVDSSYISAAYAQNDSLLKRIGTSPTPSVAPRFEDRSTNIRLNVEWPRAIRALKKNPLLGTGYSSITLATDNDYLRLLGETGLLGFFGFLLVIARIGVKIKAIFPLSRYSVTEQSILSGYYGGFAGILINALFIDVFEASKFAIIFWLLSGLTLCLISKK